MPHFWSRLSRLHTTVPAFAVLSIALGGCVVSTQSKTTVTQAATVQSVAARPAQSGAPAQAAAQRVVFRGAHTGIAQKVASYSSVNPDCSSNGVATGELLTAPVHGTVTFEQIEAYSTFPAGNQRYECNKKKTPALGVIYKSAADYKGRDEFEVKTLFPDGLVDVHRFVINVE